MKKTLSFILSLTLLLSTMTSFSIARTITKNTDFITSMTDIDKILERPYDGAVPSGFSELIYASHSSGYGFDKNTIAMTGHSVNFDMLVDINADGKKINFGDGIYRPSYVESTYDTSKIMSQYANIAPYGTVSATYEYTAAVVKNYASCMIDGVIDYDNSNANRWATWKSPNNADTITFDLVYDATVDKINLHYYTDGAGTLFPSNVVIKYLDGSEWKEVTGITYPSIVNNGATEYKFDKVTTSKIAITLTRAASNKGMAITEAQIFGKYSEAAIDEISFSVNEKKVITANSIAASIITVTNNSKTDKKVTVTAKNTRGTLSEKQNGKYVTMSGDGFEKAVGSISKTATIKSGESAEFIAALSFADTEEKSKSQVNEFFADKDRLNTHKTEYFNWFKDNVPYFECSDKQLTQMYWFRWLTYRNNIRLLTTDKYMISEFVPNVGWAGAYNSITAPVHHHIGEGRWLKDSKYTADYKDFFFENEGVKYTYYIAPFATAYYSDYLVNGNKAELISHLDNLISVYNMWEAKTAGDTEGYFDTSSGLWYVGNGHDAMEYSLSYHIAGQQSGTKISINTYMYSEAVTIAKIAELAGKTDIAEQYAKKAADIKQAVESKMWNGDNTFFETYIPLKNGTIDALELTGYMPWYSGLATDSEEYAKAWKYLTDPDTFYGDYGLATADKSHPFYNTYYTDKSLNRSGSCNWDGASWPFLSSLVLVGAANTLNDYHNNTTLTVDDYYKTLKAYTNGMYKNGYAWVGENLDSDTGKWYIDHASRSWHYNHSSYADLIITGLVGLRPNEASDNIVINPLVPDNTLTHFVLENVNYRGNNVTVVYDADGSHYDVDAGLTVYVNGKKTAHSDSLTKLEINYCENDAHDLRIVAELKSDCKNDGHSEYVVCNNCDYIDGYETYKSQGHVWGEWVYNNDATEEADGTETRTCTVCHTEKETRTKEGTKLEPSVVIQDTSKKFKDVKEKGWYKKAVDYCYSYGFIAGTSVDTFGINTNVTRGMFITILARIAGVDTGKAANMAATTKFTDVKAGKYYAAAIKWANDNGIVSGTSETTFDPENAISRQDLCVMIVNYANFMKVTLAQKEAEIAFSDATKIFKYARNAVKACQMADIVNGYAAGTGFEFRPKNTATRAEAAQILFVFHSNFMGK